MYLALLALAGLLFLGLSIKSPKLALTILPALLPTYLLRFHIGPLPMTLLEVFILTIVVTVGVREKVWHRDLSTLFGPYSKPFLFLLGTALIATAIANDLISALGYLKAFFIEPLLLFVAYRAMKFDKTDFYRTLNTFGWTMVALGLFAVFQVATGLATPAPWDFERRATSLFDYPNALGLFAAPLATLFITLAIWSDESKKRRVTWLSFGLVGVITCALSQTEAALVAIPATLVIVAFCKAKSVTKKSALALASIAALITLLFVPTIRQKLTLHDTSGLVRRSQWSETVAMLTDNPKSFVFGAGLGGYPEALKPHHDGRIYEIFQYPHNIILNIWTELGLLGLIAITIFKLAVYKQVKRKSDDLLLLAISAAFVTMTIHGLVDVPFFKNDLAALTAILLAMTAHDRNSK